MKASGPSWGASLPLKIGGKIKGWAMGHIVVGVSGPWFNCWQMPLASSSGFDSERKKNQFAGTFCISERTVQ